MLKPIYVTYLDEKSQVDFQTIRALNLDDAYDEFIGMPSNVDYRVMDVSYDEPTLESLMAAA